jgi:hypothetical protein
VITPPPDDAQNVFEPLHSITFKTIIDEQERTSSSVFWPNKKPRPEPGLLLKELEKRLESFHGVASRQQNIPYQNKIEIIIRQEGDSGITAYQAQNSQHN